MIMENAAKICNEIGGYLHCEKCPLYAVCTADYDSTPEYETAMENAAINYLKGRES